jgi:hypothetical protein
MEKIWDLSIHHVYLKNDIMCIMVKGKWDLLIYENKNKEIYELIIKEIGSRYILEGKVDINTINKDILNNGDGVYSRILFRTIGNWNNKCWKYMEDNKNEKDEKLIRTINSIIG